MRTHLSRVALLTMLCAVAVPSVTAQNRAGGVRRARAPIPDNYIVVLATSDDPEAVAFESAALRRGRIKHVYRHAVRGFAIRVSATEAAALARDPRVAYVEEDARVRADLIDSPAPWGLDRIDQRALPLDNSYSYPPPARDVRIHVLDTGVRTSHVEFGGRAFNAGDFVDDNMDWDSSNVSNDDGNPAAPDGQDCNGHGTHVAATIAGASYGVVRNATVFSYRVLDCHGEGTLSSVLAGVDAVTADSYRPAVANMSLSGDISETLDAAVRRSIAAGVTYVIAAGNDAVDASTQSPGRVAEAITVGATGINDARASFSNYGTALDLFAPGVAIPSAWFTSDTAVAESSGTSMSTPHVTGVAALYLEQVPTASPATIRNALVSTATPGLVGNAGTGSPNLLLYSGYLDSGILSEPPQGVLPPPWNTRDIGTVSPTGSASFASGTFTIDGSGADVWGTADAFRFVYQTLPGDGSITARVGSVLNVHAWSKAAVMIRDGLSPGAANAAMLVSAAKGISFQRRTSSGGVTAATLASGAAPTWIKLTRAATTFSAYYSADGVAWTLLDKATITMPRDVLVGLAVTSHYDGRLARATFTDVRVVPPGTAVGTTAFHAMDVGAISVPGLATHTGDGSFELRGAGADVWGNVDAFHYLFRTVSGDFDIESRVQSVEAVHPWTKVGVMIRETLRADSRHAFALVSSARGVAMQYRAATAGLSAQAAVTPGIAPRWVKLSRRGSQISAYQRTDGGTWQPLGSTTMTLPSIVYVGVAVTSHDATRAANATVSYVKVVN